MQEDWVKDGEGRRRRAHKRYVDVFMRLTDEGRFDPLIVMWPDGRAFPITEVLDRGELRPRLSRRVDRALSRAHRGSCDQSFSRATRIRCDARQAARRAMVGGGVRVRLRGRRGPGGVEPGGVRALGIGRLLGLRAGRLVCSMCVLGALSKRATPPRRGCDSARRASRRWRGTSPRPRVRWWSRRWS